MKIFSAIFLCVALTTAHAVPYTFLYQPPAGTWANAGVTGGIPTTRTQDGATITATSGDRQATIQSRLSGAAANTYVLLGAGTFQINSAITIPPNVTLRGSVDGNNLPTTFLDPHISSGAAIIMGSGSNDHWGTTPATVTSAVTQGVTTLTVASTSNFTAGVMIRVEVSNQQNNAAIIAGAVPVIDIKEGAAWVRTQITKLVSKDATHLTISPGLLWDSTGLTVQVKPGSTDYAGCAMESIKLDGTNITGSTFPVYMQSTRDCWIYNCEIYHPNVGYGIAVINGLTCTFQRNYVHGTGGGGSNGSDILFGSNYGALTGDGVCSSKIEDCILTDAFPHIEVNFSSGGNVYAYNYCYGSSSFGANGGSIFTNHGPHNSYSLYEGNVAPNIECDGFFGGTSEDTIFRNYLYGTNPGASDRATMILKRLTRRYQVVGNRFGGSVTPYAEVGTPNIGNTSSTGTAQPTLNDFWTDWPNNYPTTWVDHYQELDLDVAASSTFLGNYYNSGTVISGESLGGQTLPDSLYLSAKPVWFYGLSYPIDASISLTQESIPAGYRYAHGGVNPPSGSTTSSSTSGQLTLKGGAIIK